MELFNRGVRGYSKEEVKTFLDQVIKKVELMTTDNKLKDEQIKKLNAEIVRLSDLSKENQELKQKLQECDNRIKYYERTEATFNKAIMMAQKTSDQMRLAAHKESETLINEAKKNANRIINEALLKAEKTEMEANMLERNLKIYKKKIKDVIESQLEIIDDLDKIEM